MKKMYLSCLLMACVSGAFAQNSRLVEKIEKKGSALVIPYEKYILDNGLTVILSEDHSDPLVHVDVSYHVGSAREEIGKSGFAHFFEHMMFEGSDHVKSGDHFKIVSSSGGDMNGTTSSDKTHYFETVPNNQLEKMLWLESDRMGFLLDAVTQLKFEIQRETVKNERGQNYDNRPYGLWSEAFSKALYPYGHPYSWLTIGYIQDLNRVDVNDLKRFFLRWYGPNNATLTIAGDIDVKQTLAWVEKYFGSIPRGPEVKPTVLPAPVVDKERYVSYMDNYAQLPMVCVVYPGVKVYDKDARALDALSAIVGQGKSSLFYKYFIEGGKAVNASVFSENEELAGAIVMQVLPYPNLSLASVKGAIDSLLDSFEKQGVTDADLARYKGSAEADLINNMASVAGKVNALADAQLFSGNPNRAQKDLDEIRGVTKEDVMRVYDTYIRGHAAVCLSVLPKSGNVQPVAPDNYTVDTTHYQAPDYGYGGSVYHKPVDNFDRSKQPSAGPNPVVKVPAFWKAKMPNGIKVIGSQNSEIPAVQLEMEVRGGALWARKDTSKAGLASLVSQMMNEGTEQHTAEAFSGALERMGSQIEVRAENTDIVFSVYSLTKNLDATLALFEERLLHSKFTDEAFSRIQQMMLQGLQNRKSQASAVASEVFNMMLYAPGSVRPIALSGTESTVARLKLADVQSFYNNYFAPGLASISVVGDVDQATIMGKLQFLKGWNAKPLTLPAPDTAGRRVQARTIYFVDVPHAAQSQIRLGYLTNVNYDATGLYYRLGILNYPLGEAFSSRINLELREVKGWTYGAFTYFNSSEYGGVFTAMSGLKVSATDSAVAATVAVLDKYGKGGITQDELVFTRNSIGQSDALKYETNYQKADFLANIQRYNLAATYVSEQQRILAAIGKPELDVLARKYIDPSKMTILVVGDKEKVFAGLSSLGYKVVELDADGRIKQ